MKTSQVFLLLLLAAFPVSAQQIQWQPREDLNILLPGSVAVFESSGQLEDGALFRAVYAKVELDDENLKLRALGSNTHRETTKETYDKNNGILAINGGYFSGTHSVSLLVSDGEVISPGLTHNRPRGGFGLVDGELRIFWTHAENAQAEPRVLLKPDLENTGRELQADQAVGGGPVLMKNGEIMVSSAQEGFGGSHVMRHPRSAIGYIDENTLIMMVVDGRQKASAGVTLPELAQLMKSTGALEAVNLDGGGSSALVAAGEVVNIPTDITNGDRNRLRKNASALVLSERLPSERMEVHYLDTDSGRYRETGLWKSSNLANYYSATPSRQARADSHNSASYRFELPRKKYQLAAWWPVHENNSKKVAYILHRQQATDTVFKDQTALSSSGRWNLLGNFLIGPGDSLEITGTSAAGNIQTDAIRLVPVQPSPVLPTRGDLRIAVVSDLNSGLGAADYEWQVDSIINRIPRLWQPDLVISGGDMVAGMGISDTAHLRRMWRGFDEHIAAPLRKAKIPFAFTLGNHDGPRSYPLEREMASEYWNQPSKAPGIDFVDREHFPDYYSFVHDDIFFVSWDASSSEITEENLQWVEEQFRRPEARNARYRFVMGHMPLYSVAQERDSRGNLLQQPEKLRQLLEKHEVHTYISGHQHAYYPGKRGQLQLLNTGAAGSGPRGWLTQERRPVNSITLMDIFYEQDSIAYTTYKIKEHRAADMQVFEEEDLPSAMFGVNGYLIRRDLPLATEARGEFSGLHVPGKATESGRGQVQVQLGDGDLRLSGSFQELRERMRKKQGLGLYLGRNTEEGILLKDLTSEARGRKRGRFRAEIPVEELLNLLAPYTRPGQLKTTSEPQAQVPGEKVSSGTSTPENGEAGATIHELEELLATGALHLSLKTSEGELRAQLLPADNTAPEPAEITSHLSRNTYAVRDLEALYEINWKPAADPEGDFVSYTYQLARDPEFNDLVLEEKTGRSNGLKQTEQYWFHLLGDAGIGEPVTFYQRVLASDGRNRSISPIGVLRLFKSEEPLDDLIETPAPAYEFAGKLAQAPGAGYGAEWDQEGKLWLADYRGALIIQKPDGSPAAFSPLTEVEVNGEVYGLNPVNGIGVGPDGNILVGRNRHLLKIDASTGKGIAAWKVPEGGRAITSPRVNRKGEIYAMSLFGEDPNYVLKHSPGDSGFELLRTLELDNRILSRTFDMSADAKTLYFPNPGSPEIQRYTSEDGSSYTEAEAITSTAAGSSGIHISRGGALYAAVRASGISPSSIHYRNEEDQKMWTLQLPEVNGAEPRGIGVSPDGKTIIFCSWDKGGGYYKYILRN